MMPCSWFSCTSPALSLKTTLTVHRAGYIVSAIFVCWEYQRLGIHYRQHRILALSFWIKLFFIFIEVALAIAFGVTNDRNSYNASAVLEWTVAFIFTFYILSYAIDFLPAIQTKHHHSQETNLDMAEQGIYDDGTYHGNGVNGTAPGATYGNGAAPPVAGGWAANGVAPQHAHKPQDPVVPASTNF